MRRGARTESRSPHISSTGTETLVSSLVKSGVFKNPSNASRQTRAGTFSVSETTASRWSAGMARARVLNCHSLANGASDRIGQWCDRRCHEVGKSGIMIGWNAPINTRRATRSGWSMTNRCATLAPIE